MLTIDEIDPYGKITARSEFTFCAVQIEPLGAPRCREPVSGDADHDELCIRYIEQHRAHPPQATAPPHPEASGDMPVPNCLTCISGPGGKTFPEQADGGSAKPTFRNPLVFGGLGLPVPPGKKIEIVCRFFQPNAPDSVKRDGWWYLIASPPWNRRYYTVANSYLNGDPPEGPYINTVDNGVPKCTTKS